jgi:hypothetical protein
MASGDAARLASQTRSSLSRALDVDVSDFEGVRIAGDIDTVEDAEDSMSQLRRVDQGNGVVPDFGGGGGLPQR